jgi:predicted MFS family arabinose efflux permease
VPESRDPESAPGLDVSGAVLGALGLGLLTWGLTTLGSGGMAAAGWGTTAAGVVALVAFVLVERRSPHPLVPPTLFANPVFSAANAATLLIYGPLSVVFLVLVLQLQTVAGFSPVAAGTALLPLTVIMFLFSARVGALAGRIGPRLPMTVGPLVSACGLLLLLRVGPDATWIGDVLPAMIVFGAGMTLTVSPLTATVLDAAPDRFAGSASGVNNAVARAAGLLAVAVIPGIAGITGDAYADPAALDAGFRMAVLISAGLVVAAAVVSFVFIRRARTAPTADRVRVEECLRCEVTAPMPHPANW